MPASQVNNDLKPFACQYPQSGCRPSANSERFIVLVVHRRLPALKAYRRLIGEVPHDDRLRIASAAVCALATQTQVPGHDTCKSRIAVHQLRMANSSPPIQSTNQSISRRNFPNHAVVESYLMLLGWQRIWRRTNATRQSVMLNVFEHIEMF